MSFIISFIRSIALRIYHFFLYEESSRKVALFRIFLGCAVLLTILTWHDPRQLFTDAGLFPTDTMHALQDPLRFSLFFFIRNPSIIVGCYYLLIVATLCFIFGIYSRLANLILYILLISFLARTPMLDYGGTNMLQIACFYSLFLHTDQALVPAWIPKRPSEKSVPGWPMRMIQLQLGLVYLFAGIAKLQGVDWLHGSALYSIMMDPTFSFFNVQALARFPWIFNLMSYATLATELLFNFWIWIPSHRRIALAAVVIMHIGLILTMNVHYFSETMICTLSAFLSASEAEWVLSRSRSVWKKIQAIISQQLKPLRALS
jgi:hypothetical protein